MTTNNTNAVALLMPYYSANVIRACEELGIQYHQLEPIADVKAAVDSVVEVGATRLIVHGFYNAIGGSWKGLDIAVAAAARGIDVLVVSSGVSQMMTSERTVHIPHCEPGQHNQIVCFLKGESSYSRDLEKKAEALEQEAFKLREQAKCFQAKRSNP